MLEIAASVGMLPAVWRSVSRRLLVWLLMGYVIGAPLGLYALDPCGSGAGQDPLFSRHHFWSSAFALLRGFCVFVRPNLCCVDFRHRKSYPGAVNGVSAVGGLPVVLLMLANSASAAVTRASIVAFLLLGNIYATAFTFGSGIITDDVMIRFVIFLVPMAMGVFLGSRQFVRSSPESFKALALWLLIGLASLGLLRLAF